MATPDDGIVPASITVLAENVAPVAASINSTAGEIASAHDVLRTVLPDILADIAPNLPKIGRAHV